MPSVSEKKLKLLYIAQMLLEKTDEQHSITLPQMLEELAARGIQAERKSLYDDLETLRHFGFPIETRKTKCFEYYLSEHRFSAADLALLADAVRQAPFLSQRKAAQLIKKISTLGSEFQAEELLQSTGERQEQSPEPVSSEETSQLNQLSTEELLNWAMERDVQVIFQTTSWKLASNGALRKGTKTVTVSPWRLSVQEGVPRLLAYDGEEKKMKLFPVAEISQVQLLSQPREGEKSLPDQERLILEFSQEIMPQVAARFGEGLILEQLGKGKFRTVVKTPVDLSFFSWLFACGSEVKLVGPKKVAEQFRERAKSLAKAYKS